MAGGGDPVTRLGRMRGLVAEGHELKRLEACFGRRSEREDGELAHVEVVRERVGRERRSGGGVRIRVRNESGQRWASSEPRSGANKTALKDAEEVRAS